MADVPLRKGNRERERRWNLLVCPTACEINEIEVYFYFNVLSYCGCLILFIKWKIKSFFWYAGRLFCMLITFVKKEL